MKTTAVLISLLVGVAACAHTPPPKAPAPKATDADCVKVYDNLVTIAIRDNFGPPEQLNDMQRMVATAIVESTFQESGAAERFFTSCLKSANVEQTACMSKASNLDSVRLCAKTYETKKNL